MPRGLDIGISTLCVDRAGLWSEILRKSKRNENRNEDIHINCHTNCAIAKRWSWWFQCNRPRRKLPRSPRAGFFLVTLVDFYSRISTSPFISASHSPPESSLFLSSHFRQFSEGSCPRALCVFSLPLPWTFVWDSRDFLSAHFPHFPGFNCPQQVDNLGVAFALPTSNIRYLVSIWVGYNSLVLACFLCSPYLSRSQRLVLIGILI